MTSPLSLQLISEAKQRLQSVITETPLNYSPRLSEKYGAKIYLKREDLQVVRSYKIRGAYNKVASLSTDEQSRGVVCASAGNHAQGVAFACSALDVQGVIYMPANTPKQKIERVKHFGGRSVKLILSGDTFDAAKQAAQHHTQASGQTFVHPFDDVLVISGQATVAVEIAHQLPTVPDVVIGPIGGGGLMSGVGYYLKTVSPSVKLIGVEPLGAACMKLAFERHGPTPLSQTNSFVDGAAVKEVGQLSYQLCRQHVDQLLTVHEGKVCQEMIEFYQADGIVTEPAGALSVASLDQIQPDIQGKTVVCIVSGGNNDLARYPEVIERSLLYQGQKHYFLIEFSQRPGALRRYLNDALGPHDDITLFEYVKKNNREFGPALVGIELGHKADFAPLVARMKSIGLSFEVLAEDSSLYHFLV